MSQSNLSKLGLVGRLDLLPLAIASSRQQLQDGILIRPYGNKQHSYSTEPQVFVYNCPHVRDISYNNEYTLSSWAPDYKHCTHMITTVSHSQCVFAHSDVSQVSPLLSCLRLMLSGWSSAQTAVITAGLTQRGTSFNKLSHWFDEGDLHTDTPSFNISNDSRHTRISPSPFIALYRTPASSLALKFPLAFTVPLPACKHKDVTKGGLSCCISLRYMLL